MPEYQINLSHLRFDLRQPILQSSRSSIRLDVCSEALNAAVRCRKRHPSYEIAFRGRCERDVICRVHPRAMVSRKNRVILAVWPFPTFREEKKKKRGEGGSLSSDIGGVQPFPIHRGSIFSRIWTRARSRARLAAVPYTRGRRHTCACVRAFTATVIGVRRRGGAKEMRTGGARRGRALVL